MPDQQGLDFLIGISAFASAIFLFAASGYSMFIRMRIPKGKFSVIFPYLTMGMFLLGFMMISYSVIFLSGLGVITLLTTALFFMGTFIMMVGAYKVTLEFGELAPPPPRPMPKTKKRKKAPASKKKVVSPSSKKRVKKGTKKGKKGTKKAKKKTKKVVRKEEEE